MHVDQRLYCFAAINTDNACIAERFFFHQHQLVTAKKNIGSQQHNPTIIASLKTFNNHFVLLPKVFGSRLVVSSVSSDKKLYSTLSLFTQVYKWVPAVIMLGGNLAIGGGGE